MTTCEDLKNCSGNGICNEVTLPVDQRPCHKMGCDFDVECCEIGQDGKGCAPGAKSESACTIHHEGKWHPITTHECQCKPGWSGDDCGKKDPVSCAALENCSGHGSCVEMEGRDAKCRCKPGFSGKICNQARCPQNYFYNVHLDDCEPCTSCDADSIVEPGKECTGYTTSDSTCVPLKKCQQGEFVNSSNECQKCQECDPGWVPVSCGGKFDTVCKKVECSKGYFYEYGACTPCTKCPPGKHVKSGTECDGTTTLDNMCVDMEQKKSTHCADKKFEFHGKVGDKYTFPDAEVSCVPCSNCVDGFCKPGQYFNGRTLKCEACRTCLDQEFHKGVKQGVPPCDGTRTTNNLCVQSCNDNQYVRPGNIHWFNPGETDVHAGTYPGAVWWNEYTCHNCDACAGKTKLNPCNGNSFKPTTCVENGKATFWCGETEDTCVWDKDYDDPWYTGYGYQSDWGEEDQQKEHCKKFSAHMANGDSQLYSKPAGFKKVSTLGYHTYMLGCTIPDQYKGTTACTNKVDENECNKAKGCAWCAGITPGCTPVDKVALEMCNFTDGADCYLGRIVHDDGKVTCNSGCKNCTEIEPACLPNDKYDHICQKWP